jgi:hypothetical protein
MIKVAEILTGTTGASEKTCQISTYLVELNL